MFDAEHAAAAPFNDAGNARGPNGPIEAGRAKLHTDLLNKLARVKPTGHDVYVNLVDPRSVSAAELIQLRLLVR